MDGIDISDFYVENSDSENEVDFDCLTLVDAMSMADEAWSLGAGFDIDPNLLARISSTSVVRIVQFDKVKVEGHDMCILWGEVDIEGLNFEVPIRFYALESAYTEKVFKHKSFYPDRSVDLQAYIEKIEEIENSKWENVLNA